MATSTHLCLALSAGLAGSVGIEALLVPRARFPRHWWAWSLHAGCWLVAFAVLAGLTRRPWCAAAGVSAGLLLLVMVSNVKTRTLREPFVFRDFEYFVDMLRHPRLFFPFMGWARVAIATLAFAIAVATALWLETPPANLTARNELWVAAAVVGAVGVALLWGGTTRRGSVSFDPSADVVRHGLLAVAWCYACAERGTPRLRAPFATPIQCPERPPHLIAVQSESFFDAREMFGGIRKEVLGSYDALRDTALAHGALSVPAWGANTARTEFAFLAGLDNAALGAHRFKPTRLALRTEVATLASALRNQGYRTICVHPYPASFYARDRTFPNLGFDLFFDIGSFQGARRSGPYIGDAAVADKTLELLDNARQPLFIYVITMENHGPLHLESVDVGDVDALYTQPPPHGCEELTVYLRHIRNADRMAGRLHEYLEAMEHPASLCWFGDHVPIMSAAYDTLGAPPGHTHYLMWRNRCDRRTRYEDLGVELLARRWLLEIGFGHGE